LIDLDHHAPPSSAKLHRGGAAAQYLFGYLDRAIGFLCRIEGAPDKRVVLNYLRGDARLISALPTLVFQAEKVGRATAGPGWRRARNGKARKLQK
jgi:hypothetical protein